MRRVKFRHFAFLAVDPQVGTTEGKTFDIIFVGTPRGRVIKAINAQAADASSGVETIVIEELQIFDPNVIIRELKVMGGGLAGRKSLGRIAVMSDLEVRSLAVQRLVSPKLNISDLLASKAKMRLRNVIMYQKLISFELFF